MSTSLQKLSMCVLMRQGVEIWVENEKAEKLQEVLQGITQSKFIRYEGQTINTADIVGVFSPETLDNQKRIKRGERLCKQGTWHSREQDCECVDEETKKALKFLYGPSEVTEITDEDRLKNLKTLDEIRDKMLNRP